MSNTNRTPIIYNGVEYKSVRSACKELGLSYGTIQSRMRKYRLSSEETIDFYNAKRDFDILKKYFAINDTVTSKEGLFIDCTCNKCNIRAILGVDTMRKHIEVCYAE